MTKHYCDKCEQEARQLFSIPVYEHIKKMSTAGHCQVIDGVYQPYSGLTFNIDLCLICYNENMKPFYESLKPNP